MKFIKMQGVGNDFVMLMPENPDHDWHELARRMCDRHFGIGADGIILALPSNQADVRMRIFNSDGSEAEICGNGLRCLARFSLLNGLVPRRSSQIRVETIPGIRTINLSYQGDEPDMIQVGIGVPKFVPADIPVNIDYPLMIGGERLYLSFVSMGNPHAVFFINKDVKNFPLAEIGPLVENHVIFPKRINFEIARVLDRSHIEMRVWERGAGETLACGTGACAVAVAAMLHKFTDNIVDIKLLGGVLNIKWAGQGDVLMSGPAEVVFSGDWP
jgi:diaminopimelate epimerase